jgi:transposase-like protein
LLKISKERNMLVAERFLDGLIKIHGKHGVFTDGGGTYMVSSSMSIPETKTSYPFLIGEKPYRENYAISKG